MRVASLRRDRTSEAKGNQQSTTESTCSRKCVRGYLLRRVVQTFGSVGPQVPSKGLWQGRGLNRPVVTRITPETPRSSPGQGEATGNRGGGL